MPVGHRIVSAADRGWAELVGDRGSVAIDFRIFVNLKFFEFSNFEFRKIDFCLRDLAKNQFGKPNKVKARPARRGQAPMEHYAN